MRMRIIFAAADAMDDLFRKVDSSSVSGRIDSAARQAIVKRSLESTPLNSRNSQRSRRSSAKKFDDKIALKHLIQLMKIFKDETKLDINEFKVAFEKIIGKSCRRGSTIEHEMEIMHMKIDTNCDGIIGWDELCTYLLLEYQEKDTMAGEMKIPFPFPLKLLNTYHRNYICRITLLPNVSRGRLSGTDMSDGNIVSISKDGLVCFWKNINNLKLYKFVNITKLEKTTKARPLWVTDMVMMPNMQKMLLSFTDSVLAVYDMATPNFERIFHITGLLHCVITMDYWFDDLDYDHAVLSLGDSGGGVCTMEFFRATRSLFGIYGTKDECIRIPFTKLTQQNIENMRINYIPEVHYDWVSKINYWPTIEGVISCSSDTTSSMVICSLEGQKENIFKVRKGIYSFDVSKEYNIIVTGGMDRCIRVWNPYVSSAPTFELRGHNASILFVAVNEVNGYIMSFSKDMELRVWAIHNHRCLQICHQYQEIDINVPCSFYFHPTTATILTGYLQFGLLEGYREDTKNPDVTSHDYPLCGALYNSIFDEVVSACHGSVVCVWDVKTGEKVMKFSNCHDKMEITAMTFDPTGRRLITGARDGSIKIWNFNNGACLGVLGTPCIAEVTCFVFCQDKMIASGWSQFLSEYITLTVKNLDDAIPKCWGRGIHKDDILSVAYQEPNLLVTSSYDGDIVLWDIQSEQVIAIVNATDIDFTPQYKRLYGKVTGKQQPDDIKETEILGQVKSTLPERATCSSFKLRNHKARSTKPRFGFGDNNAVEKVILLTKREQNPSTATLIACGAGGIVQFWNIYGGGLLGEYNVFVYSKESTSTNEDIRTVHSISSCITTSDDSILITGSTQGYLQIWDISNYCINVPDTLKPIKGIPPLQNNWKGHCGSISSIDIAEEKGLFITASSDCCVSLWTLCGKYIGTFGEKHQWILPSNSNDFEDLPPKIPIRLQQVASINTLQTIAPALSELTKSLSSIFMSLDDPMKHLTGDYINDLLQKDGSNLSDEALLSELETKRKRILHQPVKLKMRNSEYGLSVYSILKYSNLQPEPVPDQPSSYTTEIKTDLQKSDKTTTFKIPAMPKKPITEKTLFPSSNNQ